MVTYLDSLVQLCCGEGGSYEQISLVCGGSACSVWATLGLPPLMACVLSWSTLFRVQVALQGSCLKQTLDCMYFPGLSHSGSCSQVLHKGTDFVPFPCPSSSGNQVLGKCTLLGGWCILSPPWSQPLNFLGAP